MAMLNNQMVDVLLNPIRISGHPQVIPGPSRPAYPQDPRRGSHRRASRVRKSVMESRRPSGGNFQQSHMAMEQSHSTKGGLAGLLGYT